MRHRRRDIAVMMLVRRLLRSGDRRRVCVARHQAPLLRRRTVASYPAIDAARPISVAWRIRGEQQHRTTQEITTESLIVSVRSFDLARLPIGARHCRRRRRCRQWEAMGMRDRRDNRQKPLFPHLMIAL